MTRAQWLWAEAQVAWARTRQLGWVDWAALALLSVWSFGLGMVATLAWTT